MILLRLNMLLQYFISFLEDLSLDQKRVKWIRHNSVGKQKLFTEKIFGREFQVILFTRFC